MRELIKKQEIAQIGKSSSAPKIVEIDLTRMDTRKAKQLLAEFAQYANIGKNISDALSMTDTYTVSIPEVLQKGLASGKSWITQKLETGELLASISHEVDGRKQFMQNLTMEKAQMVNPEALSRLSDGLFNLAMQQQILDDKEEPKANERQI